MVVKFTFFKKVHNICFFEARKYFPRLGEGNSDQKDQVKANRAFSPERVLNKNSELIPGEGSFSVND